jgi:hypothetical protein
MKKLYYGTRTGAGGAKVTVHAGTIGYLLPARTDLRNHSRDGFQWGYGGSGPAQLALALLCDALNDETEAQDLYQDFKWAVIAKIKEDNWQMPVEVILQWVLDHRPETVIDPRGKPSRN